MVTKKILAIVGGAAVIIIAAVICLHFYWSSPAGLHRAAVHFDEALVAQVKKDCVITETSPYEDLTLGIRFDVASDTLICNRQSTLGQAPGTRQIYLWKKSAFASQTSATFFQGLVGQVSVNLPPAAPGVPRVQPGTEVTISTQRIAGTSTTVEATAVPNCQDIDCPAARIAVLHHNGETFILGEYASGVGLLDSFAFIPQGVSTTSESSL
jgi:hypothetical protein